MAGSPIRAAGDRLRTCEQKRCAALSAQVAQEREQMQAEVRAMRGTSAKAGMDEYMRRVRALQTRVSKSAAQLRLYKCSVKACQRESAKLLGSMCSARVMPKKTCVKGAKGVTARDMSRAMDS